MSCLEICDPVNVCAGLVASFTAEPTDLTLITAIDTVQVIAGGNGPSYKDRACDSKSLHAFVRHIAELMTDNLLNDWYAGKETGNVTMIHA